MEIPHDGIGIDGRTLVWFWSYLSGRPSGVKINHGPSQSGPYSRVRDLLATFTLDFSLIANKRRD